MHVLVGTAASFPLCVVCCMLYVKREYLSTRLLLKYLSLASKIHTPFSYHFLSLFRSFLSFSRFWVWVGAAALLGKHSSKQGSKQANKQTNKQASKQAGKQASKQARERGREGSMPERKAGLRPRRDRRYSGCGSDIWKVMRLFGLYYTILLYVFHYIVH